MARKWCSIVEATGALRSGRGHVGNTHAASNPSGPSDSAWNVNSRRPTWKQRRSFSTPPNRATETGCLQGPSKARLLGACGRRERETGLGAAEERSFVPRPCCWWWKAPRLSRKASPFAGRRRKGRLVWPARRVALIPSRVASVMPETRVSGDRQGGEPPSAIAMRWQPRGARFVRRHVPGDGSFAWSSDLRALRRALAWPFGRYRTRQAIGCSCWRKPASGAGGENVGGAARIEGASPARTALSPEREVRAAREKRVAALVSQGIVSSIG